MNRLIQNISSSSKYLPAVQTTYTAPKLAIVAAALPAVSPVINSLGNAPATLKGKAIAPALEWTDIGSQVRDLTAVRAFGRGGVAAKIGEAVAAFTAPKSREGRISVASTGIADLVDVLGGEQGLTAAQRAALQGTLERVISDVMAKSKPGDDLMGKIRTAVSFALWGAGVEPGRIADVTQEMSRLLSKYFPGDGEQAIAKMAEFFFAHDAAELPFDEKLEELGNAWGSIPR